MVKERNDRFYIMHHRNGEYTLPKFAKTLTAIADLGITTVVAAVFLDEEREETFDKIQRFYAMNFVDTSAVSEILEKSQDDTELYKMISGGARTMAEIYEAFAADRESAPEDSLYIGHADLYRRAAVAYKQVVNQPLSIKNLALNQLLWMLWNRLFLEHSMT